MSLKFSCLTALPSLLTGALGGVEDVGVFGRALKQGLVEVEIVNLRDFSLNARKDIDGRAVSGADGMILLPDVCQAAAKYSTMPMQKNWRVSSILFCFVEDMQASTSVF